MYVAEVFFEMEGFALFPMSMCSLILCLPIVMQTSKEAVVEALKSNGGLDGAP